MKYRDENGQWQELYLPPTGDTLPIGSVVEYDGDAVPYGYEEVTDPNVYSEEEQRIGTWVDGKPLYRLSIVLTDSSYFATSSSYDISSYNIDKVTKFNSIYSYTSTANQKYNRFPYYVSSTDYYMAFERDGYIQMRLGSVTGTFNYFIHTIEYTKTTDTVEEV